MSKTCCIEGCRGKAIARGWCTRHYARWKKNGDPLGGRQTKPGEPLEWLEAHKNWDGEGCLVFPYAKSNAGYGSLLFQGKIIGAHRAMCVLAHGEPPSPDHVAAHSCGRGTSGCVHPEHLRWATYAENALDLSIHREVGIAPPAPSRLSSEDCRHILSLRGKEAMRITGQRFGISESMVCRIQRGNRRVAAIKGLA